MVTLPLVADTDTAAPDDTPAIPVFGRSPEVAHDVRYRRFELEVETQRPATRGNPPHLERFTVGFDARFDLDAGAVFGLMHTGDAMRQAQATAVLLGMSLRDDDGVPIDWTPPATPEQADPDDEDSPFLVLDDDDEAVPRTGDDDKRPPLYLDWTGDLVEADDLRFDPLDDASSRRRFQYLMDSPRYRVRIEALNEIAEWLMADYAGRPTRRPTPSGHGPQPTRRGTGGKRSAKRG